MFRALVIDDEISGIESLKLLVERFVPEIKVVASTTKPLEGVELFENFKPEILFLDIQMPACNGFEFLDKIKAGDTHVIFTTAYNEYALKAIKARAFDYLLKPIHHEELLLALKRIKQKQARKNAPYFSTDQLKRFVKSEPTKIPVHGKDKIEFLHPSDIARLESDSNYTYIYTCDNQKFVVTRTIGSFEEILCKEGSKFMRVHQSHIVNLDKVTKFSLSDGGSILTHNEQRIPISKSNKSKFLRWIETHLS